MASAAERPSPGRARADGLVHQARILRVLAGIDWKLKYADSALGYVWSLVKPLALFSVLYVVFGRFFKLSLGFEHYPLYLLVGLVLWIFFLDASTLAMRSIVAKGTLLRKLAFPRMIVPASVTLTAAITFCVNLLAIGAFLAWNRITPRLEWLLLVPLVAELILFTLGFSLILATLFVRFRDVAQLWELLSQLLFYASPIIYPVGFLPPWAQPVAFLSPFVQVIQDARRVLLGGAEAVHIPTAADVYGSSFGHLLPVGFALATLALGIFLFQRDAPTFAERV